MTPEQHQTAKRMWAEGRKLSEISDAMGMLVPTMGGYMRRHRDDFPMRRPNCDMGPENRERVISMYYDQHMSIRAIAKEMRCAARTVSTVLNER